MRRFGLVAVALSLISCAVAAGNWKSRLHDSMPLLGHRNWICIVDSAYPLQSGQGIETIWTGEDQLSTVKAVLAEMKKWKHVTPSLYLDKELGFVDEKAAPGVGRYRSGLNTLLQNSKPTSMLHEDIIRQLDEAGKTFHVLILKTNLTIPYTSVFLRLDCAYWGATKEAALRKKMGGK